MQEITIKNGAIYFTSLEKEARGKISILRIWDGKCEITISGGMDMTISATDAVSAINNAALDSAKNYSYRFRSALRIACKLTKPSLVDHIECHKYALDDTFGGISKTLGEIDMFSDSFSIEDYLNDQQ